MNNILGRIGTHCEKGRHGYCFVKSCNCECHQRIHAENVYDRKDVVSPEYKSMRRRQVADRLSKG